MNLLKKAQRLSLCALAVCLFSAALPAATLTYDLVCILANSGTNSCSNSPTFGTVTLTDLTGADLGKVSVTVNLTGSGTNKFKDLLLNFNSAANSTVTKITSDQTGSTNLLDLDDLEMNPYSGKFDVAGSTASAISEPYTAKLSGFNVSNVAVALSTAAFNVKDTNNLFYVAVHVQNISCPNGACVPGQSGGGSIKVAGLLRPSDDTTIPEPFTTALVGAGLVAVGLLKRRR